MKSAPTTTLSKHEVAQLAKRRLKEHYGDRLANVFRLLKDPYEKSYERDVYLAIVLDVPDRLEEMETIISLAMDITEEIEGAYWVDAYGLTRKEYETEATQLAVAAREEGVTI